jgi:hypothetical protein
MCDWLLELASSLIRPDVLGPTRTDCSTAAAGKVEATGTECPLPVEKRFHYFMRSVRKTRVWQDEEGALFRRLQACFPEPCAAGTLPLFPSVVFLFQLLTASSSPSATPFFHSAESDNFPSPSWASSFPSFHPAEHNMEIWGNLDSCL